MFLPGQVENWMVLCDLCKTGLGNISVSSLKQLMGILQSNYKCRLGNNFVVNPPKSLWVVWSCVKPFLDEITIEKIKISKSSYSDELLTMFNPLQVEEKYGGKAKNLTSFWPPVVPDAPFAIEGKTSLLSDKDSYYQYHTEEKSLSEASEVLSSSGEFEIIQRYRASREKFCNSLVVEEDAMEIDLAEDGVDHMARSEMGENDNVMMDFEEAMPFTRILQRNPTFKDTAKRDSSEFLCRLSLKNSDSYKKCAELKKDLVELKAASISSLHDIDPRVELDESSYLCSKGYTCGSLSCAIF